MNLIAAKKINLKCEVKITCLETARRKIEKFTKTRGIENAKKNKNNNMCLV